MPATPVIIVNFNSGDHLAASVHSVRVHAPDAAVVVIDNASSDGSWQAVASDPSGRVRVIQNSTNVGFARAVNQAFALTEPAGSPYALLLNPDCRISAGVLAALEQELRTHPECAIAAPAVLDADGGIQGSVRGDPSILTGLFGRTTLLTRLFPGSRLAQRNVPIERVGPGTASRTVDWVSGACMLIRRSAMTAAKGFDSRYFLYWEDADLCRRLRAIGFTTRFVPTVSVSHTGGGSSRSVPALAIRAFHESAYLYYATHVARRPLTRALAWLVLAGRCRIKLLAAGAKR